jgi:hypothetical protein
MLRTGSNKKKGEREREREGEGNQWLFFFIKEMSYETRKWLAVIFSGLTNIEKVYSY